MAVDRAVALAVASALAVAVALVVARVVARAVVRAMAVRPTKVGNAINDGNWIPSKPTYSLKLLRQS